MTPEQREAWFAGVFEGEGSVYIRQFIRGKARNYHLHGGFSIQMTDKDIIDRVRMITGVGTIREAKPRGLGNKPLWCWQVQDRKGFQKVANMLRPFLGKRRLEKLAEVEAQLTWKPHWWRVAS